MGAAKTLIRHVDKGVLLWSFAKDALAVCPKCDSPGHSELQVCSRILVCTITSKNLLPEVLVQSSRVRRRLARACYGYRERALSKLWIQVA
jgi:hypothetical protein